MPRFSPWRLAIYPIISFMNSLPEITYAFTNICHMCVCVCYIYTFSYVCVYIYIICLPINSSAYMLFLHFAFLFFFFKSWVTGSLGELFFGHFTNFLLLDFFTGSPDCAFAPLNYILGKFSSRSTSFHLKTFLGLFSSSVFDS